MKVSLVHSALISCALFISIAGKSPILIVPGLMGSQLEAKIKPEGFLPTICHSEHQYKLLWAHPLKLGCLKYLRLQFNPRTGRFRDGNGVQVRARGVGATDTVECLACSGSSSSSSSSSGQYLKTFVDFFVRKGYQRGMDLRAAPYDWRLSPQELQSRRIYYNSLRRNIENMYNNYGKVTIVAHSYGGPVMLYFLSEVMNPYWRKHYIKAFIPLGAPFGGAAGIVGALAFGAFPVDIPIDFINNLLKEFTKDKIRGFASMYYLTPQYKVFGRQALVQTPNDNYNAHHYKRFFEKFLKFPMGWKMYNAAKPKTDLDPQVPTYCIYSLGLDTPVRYVYRHGKPRTIFDKKGDGTVDKRSLSVCDKWAKGHDQVKIFRDVSHLNIVSDGRVLNLINNIVNS